MRWHYTSSNKRSGTYPVGACADNCPGHDTAEEARAHYKEGLMANAEFDDDLPENRARNIEQCQFEGCDGLTTGFGWVDSWKRYSLCKTHRNPESLATLFEVYESWGS